MIVEYAPAPDLSFSAERIPQLRATYNPQNFDKATLLSDKFLLAKEGQYETFYAPMGIWPRATDKLILVGLTPGFSQMELAARLFMSFPADKRSDDFAYGDAIREQVAFAGSMRTNLCKMLDDVGLPCGLGVESTTSLFSAERSDVSTTSALVFPTFTNGKNFSGLRTGKRVAIFDKMLESQLLPRLLAAPHALIVPLGKCAEAFLTTLSSLQRRQSDAIDSRRILTGFPHPSGANGHRLPQFKHNFDSLTRQIQMFFR